MDAQLKRGLLDVCVLAAIRNNDSYGYKIIKDMKPYLELSESTLYTILKRLESADMLTVHTVEHEGRLRKYYHLEPYGKEYLATIQAEYDKINQGIQMVLSTTTLCFPPPLSTPTAPSLGSSLFKMMIVTLLTTGSVQAPSSLLALAMLSPPLLAKSTKVKPTSTKITSRAIWAL